MKSIENALLILGADERGKGHLVHQVYVALFCLEYGVKPGEIDIETLIYQNDEVLIEKPEVDEIAHIMSKIITFDSMIEDFKLKG